MAARKTLALIASATLVAGHGYVTNATIGGEDFEFYQPYQDPYKNPAPQRVSRKITSNGPVQDVTSAAIQCGADSAPAALVAEAAAGSDVELFWTLWPESHIGPTITYMAKCEGDCTAYEPGTDAVWFKVQEKGREGTSNTWGATPVMTAGGSVTYTIPECIEPGNYLVRHEIIALHSASTYPGAQFYPGCHQVKVTGGGSTAPSDLVAFPGAYKGSDPGITYNAYTPSEYTIPGPALFTCSGSGSGSGSGSSSGPSASSAAGPASTLTTATRAAAATGPAESQGGDACDVPATTTAASTSPVAASTSAAAATGADDGEACGAEEPATVTSTTSSAAAETGAPDECPADDGEPAGDDGGDDDDDDDDDAACDAPTTPTAAPTSSVPANAHAAAPTGADDGDDGDDGCGPEVTVTATITPSAPAQTGAADECPAGDEEPATTTTTSSSAPAGTGASDECPAGDEEPVGDGDEGDDGCDA